MKPLIKTSALIKSFVLSGIGFILLALGVGATARAYEFIVTQAPPNGEYRYSTHVDEAVKNFESFEQWMVGGGLIEHEAAVSSKLAAFKQLMTPFRSRFEALGFLKTPTPPPTYQPRKHHPSEFPERARWLLLLDSQPPAERCESLELAYLFAAYELNVLKPTVPITYKNMTSSKPPTDPTWIRDQRRAAWALRFIRAVPPVMFPAGCHCHDSFYCLADEARARWDFVSGPVRPIQDNPQMTMYRRPLGFANFMCGRSMNAHFIDSEITWDAGRKSREYFRPVAN